MFLANLDILKLMKVFYTIYNKLIYTCIYVHLFFQRIQQNTVTVNMHASYKEFMITTKSDSFPLHSLKSMY